MNDRARVRRLARNYALYTAGFVALVLVLAVAERAGMPNRYIGYAFLFATIVLYACIGLISRTTDIDEYLVAGRKVPAVFNGMATGADWMSAASFLGLAGGLYLQGYDGLAYIIGWTGGFVLVALLLAPYLRRFGQFTIPDFLGARYGGNLARAVGAVAAILASFVYVVAQIYAVGLITRRFTGLDFQVGVFVGLTGILVCSFLGGMRAITWTQVAQYIILILAYLIPVVMLSVKHTGNPLPQLVYGQVLQKVTERERELDRDPAEIAVRQRYLERARAAEARLARLPASYEEERRAVQKRLVELRATGAASEEIAAAVRAVADFPRTVAAAEQRWTAERAEALAKAEPPRPHAQPFEGADENAHESTRASFIALVFCLVTGTAALPHVLARYYTTPSVRQARASVGWSLLFIVLLYVTAPALAVLAKYDIYTSLVGSAMANLPGWVENWTRVDPSLVRISDVNHDGILQLAELSIGQDIIVLATPEIAGLPYVITGLVAAGALAAALSTADGLLLTISNALAHDIWFHMFRPQASNQQRVFVSKIVLLLSAFFAGFVTVLRPGDILFLVSAAFSLAASSLFPALVLGIFWRRANRWGAVAGMLVGLGVCLYYMATTYSFFGGSDANRWFGIAPVSAGVFGLPAGMLSIVLVSLLSGGTDRQTQAFVEDIRLPGPRDAVTPGSD